MSALFNTTCIRKTNYPACFRIIIQPIKKPAKRCSSNCPASIVNASTRECRSNADHSSDHLSVINAVFANYATVSTIRRAALLHQKINTIWVEFHLTR